MRSGTTSARVRAAAAVAAAVLVACQPADDPELGQGSETDPTEGPADDRADEEAPETLDELLDRASDEAARWHEQPLLAELRVEFGEDQQWAEAYATYVAPQAEQLLVVEWAGEGRAERRPRLAGLGLSALPKEALAGIPPLPEDARAPGKLAGTAAELLAECGVDDVPTAVLYASGAPDAWDPEAGQWSQPPEWTVTVTNEEGSGVTLHPVTAEPVSSSCFTATSTGGASA